MINIDNRLLEQLNESEYWLLTHIVKRMNKDNFCFPSNKTLCNETGWHIDKLQKNKKALQEKGYISVQVRFNSDRRTSNFYYVTTNLIGVFIPGDEMSKIHHGNSISIPEKEIVQQVKSGISQIMEKTAIEALTINEALTNEQKDIYVFSRKVIDILNQSKKSFGIRGTCVWTKARGTAINARLKEGNFTEEQILSMLKHRCGVWKNTEWERYLTPETLFRPTKFTGYVEQSIAQPSKGWEQTEIQSKNSQENRDGLPSSFTW